jgi:hypothetical protein
LGFAAGQLAAFQGASQAPLIAVEPATWKNSQAAAAHRVALKMVGCFVGCQSRINPDMLLPPASQTTHFERNQAQGI